MAKSDYVEGLVAGQVAVLKDLQADLKGMLYSKGWRRKGEGAIAIEEALSLVDRKLAAFEDRRRK